MPGTDTDRRPSRTLAASLLDTLFAQRYCDDLELYLDDCEGLHMRRETALRGVVVA